MLVKASAYKQVQTQNQALQTRLDELEKQLALLGTENETLRQELRTLSDSESSEDALMKCVVNSLQQVEGVRQTVLDSFERIEQEAQSVQKVNALFEVSSSALQHIVGSMQQMGGKMGGMTNSINGLSDKADSINTFVSTITSISDQTNLLALNAAIEAARAGDAGRGFSVVADEVRTLATETNKSASEVSDLVSNIINSTKSAVSSVDEIRGNNDLLSDGVNQLNQHYNEIVVCCDSMKATITDSSHRSFIQTVKLDHIVWKADVYAVVFGVSSKSIDSFASHHNCRLGNWYQGAGKQEFSGHQAYRELDPPHAQVHKSGVLALQAFAAGDKAKAMEQLLQMENASQTVMTLLDRLAEATG